MTYKIGELFKWRLDQQHMWFEVIEVLPDRYKAELRSNPYVGVLRAPDGRPMMLDSDYQWGDMVEVGKAELAEYERQRASLCN